MLGRKYFVMMEREKKNAVTIKPVIDIYHLVLIT